MKEVSEGDYIELPGRDPKMPGLYIVNNHPKVPSGKRAIVVLMDTDTKAMLAFDEFLSNMTFPEGTDEGIKSAGASITLSRPYSPKPSSSLQALLP